MSEDLPDWTLISRRTKANPRNRYVSIEVPMSPSGSLATDARPRRPRTRRSAPGDTVIAQCPIRAADQIKLARIDLIRNVELSILAAGHGKTGVVDQNRRPAYRANDELKVRPGPRIGLRPARGNECRGICSHCRCDALFGFVHLMTEKV